MEHVDGDELRIRKKARHRSVARTNKQRSDRRAMAGRGRQLRTLLNLKRLDRLSPQGRMRGIDRRVEHADDRLMSRADFVAGRLQVDDLELFAPWPGARCSLGGRAIDTV